MSYASAGHPALPIPVASDATVRSSLDTARNRLFLVAAVFAMAFTTVTARLADVTLLRDGAEPSLARTAPAAAPATGRADIVDRNGIVLATTLTTASLYADPTRIIDPAEAASKLVQVLPQLNYDDVVAKLKGSGRFVWLYRNLTPSQHYAVHRLGIPGLAFEREDRRVYPLGSLAAHVVGFTGVDNDGLAGLERTFDTRLKSSAEPLRTSVDIRLQHIVRRELAATIETFSAIGGSVMVMDVTNGEILSMVSLPDFDPHRPAEASDEARFNQNTLGVYEMGSTFKIFNSALALESGKVRMTDSFDATKPIRVGRFSISDYRGKNSWLTVPEIFVHSSNIGSVKMMQAVGVEGQRALLGKLGLLAPVQLELPELGKPMVPNPWREVNAMTISFGHGLSVSPLHMVTATAAMVNGGTLPTPTILAREGPMPEGPRVISEKTSDAVRRLMRLVVNEGTGSNAAVPGYLVGGKTGTAEKTQGKTYKKDARLSSFLGAFPMNDPRYVILAMIDEPKGTKETYGYATGGWTAAPLVSRIVAQMGPLMGLRPVDEEAPEIHQALDVLPSKGGTLVSY